MNADIIKDWADEYGVPFRGPENHSLRKVITSIMEHLHIGSVNHIQIKP